MTLRADDLVKHAEHDQSTHGNWARNIPTQEVLDYRSIDAEESGGESFEDIYELKLDKAKGGGEHDSNVGPESGGLTLFESIRQKGITTPLEVIEHGGQRFIWEGHTRLAAAKALGINEVPVKLITVDEAQSGGDFVPEWVFKKHVDHLVKHAGPGPHPGTGTPQSIHATGGTGKTSRPNIDDNPEFRLLARGLHAKALSREPDITATFSRVASSTGGELVGTDFSIKSERSIRDKIFRNIREARELEGIILSPEDAAADIRDLNRYTFVWPADDKWVNRHVRAIDSLRAEGWEIYDNKYKSAWAEGDYYDGTNIQLHKGDMFVEVQFHTPQSFEIKHESDQLYGQARLLDPTPERSQLVSQIHQLWNSDRSHVPPGAASLGVDAAFMMKASTRATNYIYLDPEGNPKVRVRVVSDRVEVFRGGKFVEASIDPADLSGHGGRADFQPLRDFIVKHAGPGSHPGTGTPQSIHGGGDGGGTAVLDRATRITTKFTTEHGAVWPRSHQRLARAAVDKFEQLNPGVLPDNVEFRLETLEPGEENTFAFSRSDIVTGVPRENVIHVNWEQIKNDGIFDEDGIFRPWQEVLDVHRGNASMVSIEATDTIDEFLEATYYHELAHLVPLSPVVEIPHYSSTWFETQTDPLKDSRLPSRYASTARHEFVAEAYTEMAYDPDNAGGYSRTVVDVLNRGVKT